VEVQSGEGAGVDDENKAEESGEEQEQPSGDDKDTEKDNIEKRGESENETESEEESGSEEESDEEDGGKEDDEDRQEVAPSTLATQKQVPPSEGQEIINIADTPPPPPVVRRFVTLKDGSKEECYPTLPGREYYSNDFEDAVFDKTQCDPPYVDWTVNVKEAMLASKALVKRYDKFFSTENQQSIKEKTVTAKVGKQSLRVRDLNTLAPGTWLNNNVIDLMTQVLASRAVTEMRRNVAVFDTKFTKLILEQPHTAGTEPHYYVYEKVVGYADKWLLGKSPTDFDCLLFPNRVNRNHWTIMAVFPKQQLIVALDSFRVGSVKDARIIFRWLYDEMKYNHPADANTLFQPYQQDLGWKYTVDKELAVQGDFYNCGVFMVGYFHCLLFRMNPRHLTPALMGEYRKRIFGAMHGKKS
jgi:hypothetical protein